MLLAADPGHKAAEYYLNMPDLVPRLNFTTDRPDDMPASRGRPAIGHDTRSRIRGEVFQIMTLSPVPTHHVRWLMGHDE